jgi:hypothetical protein
VHDAGAIRVVEHHSDLVFDPREGVGWHAGQCACAPPSPPK